MMNKLFTFGDNVTISNDNRVFVLANGIILYVLIFLLFGHTFFKESRANSHIGIISCYTLVTMFFTTTRHTQNNTSNDNNIFHDFDFRIKNTNSL